MIGTLDPSNRQVTVVGAGIAGLLMAYRLDRMGWEVTLLERARRAGGLISTTKTEHGIAESAATSLLVNDSVAALCRELGVELLPVKKESRARFVVRFGKLRRMPLGLFELLRTLFRAYFVLSIGARRKDGVPQTLEDWGLRHLGRPAVDFLLTPFLRGIYGARPSELAVPAAFPKLAIPAGHSLLSYLIARKFTRRRQFEALEGPAPKSQGMMAPRAGMEELVLKLSAVLEKRLGSRYRLGVPVHELPSGSNVVLCVPAAEAALLLRDEDAPLAVSLAAIPHTPLVSVTAFVADSALRKPVRGVGALVPEREPRRGSLGVLFSSSSFEGRAAEGFSTFTVMMGGSADPQAVDASDAALSARVVKELSDLAQLTGAPASLVIHRWPRAIPQYGAVLLESWETARAGWCSRPGRVLFGNYTGQVSLRGMIETVMKLSHPGDRPR